MWISKIELEEIKKEERRSTRVENVRNELELMQNIKLTSLEKTLEEISKKLAALEAFRQNVNNILRTTPSDIDINYLRERLLVLETKLEPMLED